MAYSSNLLLSSTNYFQWKSHIEDLLRSKGLYHIALGKEKEPIDVDKQVKWANRGDKARQNVHLS
jgi:hypothetical protein